MVKKLTATLLLGATFLANASEINGRGSSFAGPIYQAWSQSYYKATNNKVNYTPTGSGDGIKAVSKRQVDFGGTDKPLKVKKLDKKKLFMFPTVVGSIVLAYNIDGIKDNELKLSRKAIAAIFSGKAQYWDDAVIQENNKNLKLPHAPITVCVRADKSGTTYNFTYFLHQIDPSFKISKKPHWIAPKVVEGKSNAGVTANIKQIKNSIGYIEYSYKLKSNLPAAQVENKEGKFIAPTMQSFQDAAKYASWSKDKHFYAVIGDPKGASSYPIIAATFVLLPRENTQKNKEIINFFDWSFKNGDKIASELGYVPLPKEIKDQIRAYWKEHGIY